MCSTLSLTRRHLGRALAAAALAAGVAGCGSKTGAAGGSLTILTAADGGQNYDPQTNAAPSSTQYMMPVFDTLLGEDRRGRISPGLATRAAYSDGGKTLTLTLRRGVRFQDGTPFDAKAVKANIARGQSAPKSVVVGQLVAVTKVDTPDPATVVLHLKAPSGALLGYLTGAAGMMASPASWASKDNPTHPVGTGPWAVSDASVPGSEMVYERFPGYWNRSVQRVGTVRIRAGAESTFVPSLVSDAAQAIMLTGSPTDGRTVASHGRPVADADVSYLHLLYLNKAKTGPFADRRVRQAISLAIDRGLICRALLDGACTPTGQPVSPRSWAYDRTLKAPVQDLARARALLRAAGRPEGFSFKVVVSSAGTQLQTELTAIQQMLGDIGVRMQVQPLPVPQLVGYLDSGKAEGYYSVNTGGADPAIPLATMLAPALNPGAYADPELTAPLAKAGAATVQADRASAYARVSAAYQATAFNVVVLNQDLQFGTGEGARGVRARDPLTIEARGAGVS